MFADDILNMRDWLNMSAVKNLTTRPSDDLGQIINWAIENDVEDSLKLLVDCTVIRDRINLLPTIIDRLSSKNCLETLCRWSKSDSYSYHLYKLIVSFQSDPYVTSNSNILSEHKPAKSQFYSYLHSLYVASAITERTPVGNFDEVQWFERLRLWLVIKAIRAASSHNLQDTYLRDLFGYLRMAADQKLEKLELINELMVDAAGYHPFTRAIEQKAEQISRNHDKKSNNFKFLNTLIKICNNNFHPEKFELIHPIFDVPIRFHGPTDAGNLLDIKSGSEGLMDDEDNLVEVPEDADEDTGTKVAVDSNQSQQLKELKGNSVLLNTFEELQFLPWTWNKPNAIESEKLVTANDQLLNSEKKDEQLLAALVWIAINTGRSFRRALNIQITDLGDDWALNLKEKKLIRNQPRRKKSWVPKSENEKLWIYKYIETQQIDLPETVHKIINEHISKSPHAKLLGNLWNIEEWGMPESLFQAQFRQLVPRLTPGMLGNMLPQKVFAATENDKFTRIIASHPSTGLPPASAYSAWMQNEHPQVQFLSNNEPEEKNKISAGSQLYPIESLLKKAISEAGLSLESIRQSGNLIEYHNNLTGYLYTMILASTGCRPINDLVESIRQIDFESGYFYVDDKSNGRGNKGRLLALPDRLINFLRKEYLTHLRIISQAIDTEKSPLAYEIYQLAQGQHSDKIPLLFFINDKDVLDWESVSASKVSNLNLFNWPLPSNLFRHRLAKLLPAEGICQEIVDGYLGHLESGLETYGDYSTRTFLSDTRTLRPVLNKLFDRLEFALPKHQPYLKLEESLTISNVMQERTFGSASRAINRKARIVNAIKAAKWEIEKTLGDSTFDALEEREIKTLSKVMLFHPNGLPRSDGFLRYTYLVKQINKYSRKTNLKVKLKTQYFFAETKSPFSQLSIRSQTKYIQLLDTVTNVISSKSGSRFSSTDAALLSVIIFGLENRVADKDLLIKVFMGTHFRIVQLQEQYYVEFSSSEKIEALLILSKRFSISNLCAYWMQNAKKLALSKTYLNKPVSQTFQVIANIVSDNYDQANKIYNTGSLIKDVAELINQVNVLELPGIVAGYLSGQVSSYSWSWPELIRFQLGKNYRLDFDRCSSDLNDSQLILATDFLPAAAEVVHLSNDETLQKGVKVLFRKVREALANEKKDGDSRKTTREDLTKRIKALLNQNSSSVSRSCQLLVLWVKYLISTKYSATKYFAISSIERYFSALSIKFEVLAYATNLVDMDEEDITEFYSNILSLAKENDRAYVGRRLIGFHKWARNQGVEEPDWSEIDIPELAELVSPGFIFEDDYQNALLLLTQSTSEFDIHDRLSGLLLLLTYRFGLRGGDALGLLASDLFVEDGMMVVSVSDNRLRKLKRPASRRQVPLVFKLSDCEKSIVDWSLNQLSAIPGSNQHTPLFNIGGDSLSEPINAKIKRSVINLLKQVTGNRDIVIHHARHTAANKIAHALYPVGNLYKDNEFKLIDPAAAYTLLGTVNHTRREAWASARYLGHATRSTQLRNYIHFIGDWSAQYTNPIKFDKRFEVKNVLDIAQFVVNAGALNFQLSENNQANRIKRKVTMADLIQLFRLLANGKKIELAATTLGVSLEAANFAYDLLKAVSSKSDRIESKESDLGIFQKTSPAVWKRLFEYIKTVNDDGLQFDCREIDFDIERLLPMFGVRGHILMRTEFQFRIMEIFMAVFQVPQKSFDVLAPRNANQKLIARAESCNFSPIVIGSGTEKGLAFKGYQLDSYLDSLEGETCLQRCGIAFRHENSGYARNSNNWTLLIIIFMTYSRFFSK